MLTKSSASCARFLARPITILPSFPKGKGEISHRRDYVGDGRISSVLHTLAEIRQRAEGLALFDAVILIIEQTQLRERLSYCLRRSLAISRANSMPCSHKRRKQKPTE